jgi:hypothetical protein
MVERWLSNSLAMVKRWLEALHDNIASDDKTKMLRCTLHDKIASDDKKSNNSHFMEVIC